MAATTTATAVVGVSSARAGSLRSRARSMPTVCCQQPHESVSVAADRRSMVGLVAAGSAAALVAGVVEQPPAAQAAYGEAANVFGKVSNASGYLPYAGEGYAVLLPSKWNPSKERPFPGVELYYEDNFDAVTNMIVAITPSSKKEISEYGSPEEFLKKVSFLFGEQTFSGKTKSEGGFEENKVSVVNLLDLGEETKSGKKYYKYEVLTRTADGDEGGRHQLISATVSDGALYILKTQAGDKRWFKGSDRVLRKVMESFQVV